MKDNIYPSPFTGIYMIVHLIMLYVVATYLYLPSLLACELLEAGTTICSLFNQPRCPTLCLNMVCTQQMGTWKSHSFVCVCFWDAFQQLAPCCAACTRFVLHHL